MVASDAPSLRREVASTTPGPDVKVLEAPSGPALLAMIDELEEAPDLVVVDMQMGNMGGMAVCLDLRLEESYGALEHVPVLMLLDRRADVFLAKRSGAEGWLVKPLDPIRIRRATAALVDGGTYHDQSYHPLPELSGHPLPELAGSAVSAQMTAPQPPQE